MSRPYNAGAVTAAYRPTTSAVQKTPTPAIARRDSGFPNAARAAIARMQAPSSIDSSPRHRIAGVGHTFVNVSDTSSATIAAVSATYRDHPRASVAAPREFHSHITSTRNEQASALSPAPATSVLAGGARAGINARSSATICATQIALRRTLGASGARSHGHAHPAATKA